ncbi:MAG: hypothetical protein ABUU24_00255 [Variovorax sp.]
MAIRFILIAVLSTLAVAARADNPPHECIKKRGCIEEKTPTHDVGRGVILTLPKGWKYYSYPQAPIPEMAGLRETRAFSGHTDIAITPFPNIDKREITDEWVRDILGKACGQYAPSSKEGATEVVSISHDDLVGGYCSFSAAKEGEKPFAGLANRSYSNITTFVVSYRFVILSVTIGTENPGEEAYAEAIEALKTLK